MPAGPPQRLARLPARRLAGFRVATALGSRARLLGLAWLDPPPAGHALHLPRCRSVHTFGMRFAIDIVFLDRRSAVIRVERGVPPRRLVTCRGAAAVVETAAGGADALVPALRAAARRCARQDARAPSPAAAKEPPCPCPACPVDAGSSCSTSCSSCGRWPGSPSASRWPRPSGS